MPKALLVYPEQPRSFWSFDEALDLIDKKSAFPPLGLLTIAGMMPHDYDLRVVDMNVAPLTDPDLEWADVVITSSMIIHWDSLETVIARCNERGVAVLCGGPLPTQYCDEIRGDAVFYRGEAENGFLDVLEPLLADPAPRGREIVDRRGQFRSLAETPLPRWDLIDVEDYSTMLIQITRGCPESCTFCNIPSLYGKTTRLKSRNRMLEELEALSDMGWRGAIMVVDDNFIGNQEDIRRALEEGVIDWQQERGYPFQLNTQVSVRLSDNPALLGAMNRAGFGKVFCGIESPSEESLKFMGAQKNLQGDTTLLEKIRVLQHHGFEVQAGLIVGFDTDPDDHQLRRPPTRKRIGLTELRALGRSLWRDGVTGSYRREYWRFLGTTLRRHPQRLGDAISLSVQGRHLILTTQSALREEERKAFGSEEVAYEGAFSWRRGGAASAPSGRARPDRMTTLGFGPDAPQRPHVE